MGAAAWFAAAILVAVIAHMAGLPLNSGLGLLVALFWLVGAYRLAVPNTGRPQR
jgi:hypothetical protein